MNKIYFEKSPSCLYAGAGCIHQLEELFPQHGVKMAVIFTDQGVASSGLLKLLTDVVDKCQVSWKVYDQIPAEPSYMAVDEMASFVRGNAADIIIALGGGSVMDSAKLCSMLADHKLSVRDLLNDPKLGKKKLKTIMLPTTCGTGAEATCNAIVAVPEENMKVGIVNDEMIPDIVLLEPELIRRLPPKLVAATGVDALTHVVECFTSLKANPISDVYAGMGAKKVFHNIKAAYAEPDNMEAKESMLLGAHLGGLAITASGTTAVHALSYPLGGRYHIPHGVSNAILFAPVMRMNRDACKERFAALSDIVWPECSQKSDDWKVEHMIQEIEDIVSFMRIPASLAAFNVPKEDLEWLVDAGSKVTRLLSNNRKELTLDEIRSIYQTVL